MTYPEPDKAKAKDLLKARGWGKKIIRPGLLLMAYPLLLGVICMIISPVLMVENSFLRTLINAGVLLLAGFLLFNSGAGAGEKDAQASVRLMRDINNGYQPEASDFAVCFHRMKGVCAALLGAAPWFLMALVVAVLARPYAYLLQDLPSYLGGYQRRWDLGMPLTFYNVEYSIAVVDILRIIVRMGIMPFIYLGGSMTDAHSLLIDRIGPLLVLYMPLCYAVGYQFGPHYRLRNYERNQEAKKQHMKKVKRRQKRAKAARERAKPEQLI